MPKYLVAYCGTADSLLPIEEPDEITADTPGHAILAWNKLFESTLGDEGEREVYSVDGVEYVVASVTYHEPTFTLEIR